MKAKTVDARANIWLTADWHLGHTNIIKYCDRPFQTIEEMNDAIRDNHNKLVSPSDTVYFLGDLMLCGSWIDIKSNFNGHFQYIWGNHDRKIFVDGSRPPYGMCVKHFNKKIYLTHFPKNLPRGFDIYFTAHHHDHYKFAIVEGIKVLNVGVDVWNFRPISMKHAIKEYFNKNNWLGVQNIS